MFFAKIPALMGWPFTLIYLALWLLTLYFMLFSIPKALKTNQWVETTANVFENKLVKSQRTHSRTHRQIIVYSAKVRYQYDVEGNTYQGVSQKLAKRGENGQKIHKALLDQYPVGSDLSVYYDPANPQQSSLQKGITGLHLILGALLFLSLGWFSLLILEAAKA